MDILKSKIETARDIVFAKDYVDIILQRVLTERPKTLQELMNLTS